MPTVEVNVPEYTEPERLKGKYAVRILRSHGLMDDGGDLKNVVIDFMVIDGPNFSDGSSPLDREITLFVPFYEKDTWKDSYKKRMAELRSKLLTFGDVDASQFDTENDLVGKELWVACSPGTDPNDIVVDQIRDIVSKYEG